MAYSNPRPPLRTYSKRVPREILEPPSKKRRLEEPSAVAVSGDSTSEAVGQIRRKISDFFKPTSLSSSPTSIASTVFSAAEEQDESPPSSPPPESSSPPVSKIRVRRRLTTRPLLNMDLYTSKAHERRKQCSISTKNLAIEESLQVDADPAILGTGPDSNPMKIPKEKTLTRTQVARANAEPLRSFNSRRIPIDPQVDISDDKTYRFGISASPLQTTDYMWQGDADSGSSGSPSSLNEDPRGIDIPAAKEAEARRKQRLPLRPPSYPVQTQLDLGQQLLVTCKDCDLSYNRGSDDDKKFHDERHDAWLKGLPIRNCHNNKFIKTKKLCPVIHPDGTEDYIVEVSVHSHDSWKRVVLDALSEVVDPELGSETYTEDILFMMFTDPNPELPPNLAGYRHANEDRQSLVARFRVFVFIKNTRLVSLLLLERITWGYPTIVAADTLRTNAPGTAGPVGSEQLRHEGLTVRPAELGVNKIWTHRNHRRQGFASKLLDCARSEYTFRTAALDRDRIAWTQTTADGAALAQRYAGNKAYLCYREKPIWFRR